MNAWLTAERVRNYPRIVAVVTIAGWLVSQAIGPGMADIGGVPIGADFTAFYSGGQLWYQGFDPYDLGAQQMIQVQATGVDNGAVDAFVSPPWMAALFSLFARGDYATGLAWWWTAQLGLLVWAVRIGQREIGVPHDIPAGLVVAMGFFPVLSWFMNGQATGFLLLGVAGAVALLRRREDGVAGIGFAIAAGKPQIVLPWMVAALAGRRWATIVTTAGLVAVLALVAHVFNDGARWLALAPTLFALIRDPTYPSWGLANAFGAAVLLFDPISPWLANAVAAALTAALLAAIAGAWWRVPWDDERRRDLLLAGTVATGLVASPHLFVYDLALLLIPVALIARHEPPDADGRPLGGGRWLDRTAILWVGCFVGPYLTAAMAYATQATLGMRFALPITAAIVAWWGLSLLREARDG